MALPFSAPTETARLDLSAIERACTSRSGTSTPAGSILRNPENGGTIRQWKADNLSCDLETISLFRDWQAQDNGEAAARCFVQSHAALFGLKNPLAELSLRTAEPDELGFKHFRFDQNYRGLPVAGGELLIHLNRENQVYRVTGSYFRTPENVPEKPGIDARKAQEIALRSAAPKARECPQCGVEQGILVDENQRAHLAYRVSIAGLIGTSAEVWVDAVDGAVLKRLPLSQP